MADTDRSIYNIRYNQVTQGMEGFGGGAPMWTPLSLIADGGITQLTGDVTAGPGSGSQTATVVSTAAVKTLHADAHANLTGNVQLVSGTNITLTQSGQAITITASGSSITPNVVQGIFGGQSTTSSATYLQTGSSVSITPSSSSAKIKITACGVLEAAGVTGYATIFRDSTNLAADQLTFTTLNEDGVCMQYLDSPGDTASHSYSVQIRAPNADGAVNWGGNSNTCIIIAEEVH